VIKLQKPNFKKDKYWQGWKNKESVLVNIGCGYKPFEGFKNVDNLKLEGIEYPNIDARNLHCFDDNSVDYIYACHVLEHLPRNETFKTLLEWNRVLKLGGLIRISVPDWDATVKYYNKTGDLENLLNWIYGGRETEVKNEFTHKRIFNFSNLRSLLYEAGFKRIEKYTPWETFHGNIDDFSFAYRPHMDFENGIPMSLNIQAVK
jgi:predicted SAM-dependent methyltransferase